MSTLLDQNIDGIPCKELISSNRSRISINDTSATRIFRCNWSQRHDLAVALVGSVTVSQSGTTVQTPPKQHPDLPNLYAQEVDIERFDSGSKVIAAGNNDLDVEAISYDFARLTVQYAPFVAEFQPGGQLITEEFDVSAEVLEIEGAGYVYDGTSVAIAQKLHKVIGQVEDQIIFHRSSSSKRTTIKSLVGKVNAAKLADTDRGSMLFLGGRGRRSILTNGVEQWEIAYKFRSRTTDDTSRVDEWQKVFRPGTGWSKVVQAHDATKSVYDYGDFTQLFS